jgi:hypothetical protein
MYQANGSWDRVEVFFGELNNFSAQLFETLELAENACGKLVSHGLNAKKKIFPLATWVTFQLDDYSKHYCPFCLNLLPKNGSHWNSCDEYEADNCLPKYFPMTELQMLEYRLANIRSNNIERKKKIKQSEGLADVYQKRICLIMEQS